MRISSIDGIHKDIYFNHFTKYGKRLEQDSNSRLSPKCCKPCRNYELMGREDTFAFESVKGRRW